MSEGQSVELDNVYIGATHKLKTRLIVTKLPEEIKIKRKKIREKKARNRKSKTSNRNLDGANVYITNIPKENLSTDEVYNLYRLRWQIEIIFKIWKSIFNIDKVNNVKLERFECFVYSKLIYILLSSTIINISNSKNKREKDEYLSIFKAFKVLKFSNRTLKNICCCSFSKLYKIINNLKKILLSYRMYTETKNNIMPTGIIIRNAVII